MNKLHNNIYKIEYKQNKCHQIEEMLKNDSRNW